MTIDILKYLEEKKPEIDSLIRKYLPRKFDQQYLEWAFGKPRYSYDLESLNKSLAEPLNDFLDRGGKRWRPALFLLLTELLGADQEVVREFAVIPELAHEGSIATDDIEDLGEMRRGKPCLHKIYGVDVALNAGNFLYFLPSMAFIKNKHKLDPATLHRACEAYFQEMTNIHIGQGLDIWWHKSQAGNVSEEQYLQMCAYKTGTLARLAARLAAILSKSPRETEDLLGRLAESLGVAFQIQDDILSASPGEFSQRKGVGDDITEGKRSLLVIHALGHSSPEDSRELLDILNKHTRDTELIRRALELISKTGSIDYARQFASRFVQDAWKEAEPRLPNNPAKKTLESLMKFAIERRI
jgi:geranylgeranyl pyrophosphate synthase